MRIFMMNSKYLSKIAFSSLIVLSLSSCDDNDVKFRDANRKLDSISNVLTQQRRMNDSLKALMTKGELASNYPVFFGKNFDSIENPREYVKSALKKQPEKIPMKAEVGGTMAFREVQVISEDWVLATYDDGHVQGRSIYEYTLQPDGSMKFEVVASRSSR
ncbi:MAG: hypothetical protein WBL27_06180 [Salinimicrobium sp.]